MTTSPTAIGSRSDARGAGRDERFAGRNGDARVWALALVGHQSRIAQRGADRSLWIVLVRGGGAENRHDRLADELLDRPAEPLQFGADAHVVGREERANVLRVDRLRPRPGVEEVGEDDGDDLPLLPRRGRVRTRRPQAGKNGIVAERLQLGEVFLEPWGDELVEPLGLVEVLELMLAQIAQRDVRDRIVTEQLARGLREST